MDNVSRINQVLDDDHPDTVCVCVTRSSEGVIDLMSDLKTTHRDISFISDGQRGSTAMMMRWAGGSVELNSYRVVTLSSRTHIRFVHPDEQTQNIYAFNALDLTTLRGIRGGDLFVVRNPGSDLLTSAIIPLTRNPDTRIIFILTHMWIRNADPIVLDMVFGFESMRSKYTDVNTLN